MMALSRAERVRGGLLGLLVGDALGVPYEFHEPGELPPLDQLEMTPPPGFRRAHPGVSPGTWSDDGAQALCLAASLLDCGGLDVEDLGRRFVSWYRSGYMAVDGRVFDIGGTTREALGRLERGQPAASAGGAGERDNGNGALMRVLPLVLWHAGDAGSSERDLVADAHAQARVTHGHRRSQVCCALYCLWARRVLDGAGSDAGWRGAAEALAALYRERWGAEPGYLEELEGRVLPDYPPRGTGYVLDTLHSARYALRQGAYEAAVRAAIALGWDTDTTACVTGGIAGLIGGEAGIPRRWLDALRGRELLEPVLSALAERVG